MKMVLPYPPTNNTYFTVARGRKILSSKGRAYKKLVIDRVFEKGYKRVKDNTRLKVRIHAYPPDKRSRDLDNIPKALLDAIQSAGIYQDDSLIDDLRIIRERKEINGKVEVYIFELSDYE